MGPTELRRKVNDSEILKPRYSLDQEASQSLQRNEEHPAMHIDLNTEYGLTLALNVNSQRSLPLRVGRQVALGCVRGGRRRGAVGRHGAARARVARVVCAAAVPAVVRRRGVRAVAHPVTCEREALLILVFK